MLDKEKSKEELISEVVDLRRRLSMLEGEEDQCMNVELALADQIQFLQTLIDTIPNPVFYKDAKGIFIGCNKAFERRIGLGRKEIIGKTSFQLFPKEYAEKYHQMDEDSLMHPGEQIFETTLLYADGKLYDVIIYKGTFAGAEGVEAGVVGVIVDVTERKRAEEALRKAHDELETRVYERTAELAKANEDLRNEIAERKKAEEALKESADKLKIFAYSVAHDLKSPTIAIHGLTKLLNSKFGQFLDEKGRMYCEQILKASENVVALVEKINTYAASKETSLLIERIKPDSILRMVREEFSARLMMRRVDLILPTAVPPIMADGLALIRIFRNLVDNALKYGGENLTKIVIGYEQREKFHVFSVSDDGVGIKNSKRIFNFFQRDESSMSIEGTGLGLAIVKELAEHHGGSVWAEAGQRGGVTFFITLLKDLG